MPTSRTRLELMEQWMREQRAAFQDLQEPGFLSNALQSFARQAGFTTPRMRRAQMEVFAQEAALAQSLHQTLGDAIQQTSPLVDTPEFLQQLSGVADQHQVFGQMLNDPRPEVQQQAIQGMMQLFANMDGLLTAQAERRQELTDERRTQLNSEGRRIESLAFDTQRSFRNVSDRVKDLVLERGKSFNDQAPASLVQDVLELRGSELVRGEDGQLGFSLGLVNFSPDDLPSMTLEEALTVAEDARNTRRSILEQQQQRLIQTAQDDGLIVDAQQGRITARDANIRDLPPVFTPQISELSNETKQVIRETRQQTSQAAQSLGQVRPQVQRINNSPLFGGGPDAERIDNSTSISEMFQRLRNIFRDPRQAPGRLPEND